MTEDSPLGKTITSIVEAVIIGLGMYLGVTLGEAIGEVRLQHEAVKRQVVGYFERFLLHIPNS